MHPKVSSTETHEIVRDAITLTYSCTYVRRNVGLLLHIVVLRNVLKIHYSRASHGIQKLLKYRNY